MSFQQYIRHMLIHFLSKPDVPKGQKKNKQHILYHQWFGLFPFSIKLFTTKQ